MSICAGGREGREADIHVRTCHIRGDLTHNEAGIDVVRACLVVL